ncbi:hypothetical protein RQP46_001452 [Phenoliferia psychrophenolica]
MNGVDHRKRVSLQDHLALPLPLAKKPKLETQDDHDDDDRALDHDSNLENFRKEAIWREMQEYKRKYERAQRQLDHLELDKQQYEARLSAVDYSWNMLVKEADLLLPSTSTAQNGHSSHSAHSPPVSDPSLSHDQLSEALSQRSQATKSLLGRLLSLSPSSSSLPKVEQLQESCQSLLDQSLRSQEALRLLRVEHESTLAQLEETHNDLLRAEKRLDRVQSKTVAAIEGRHLPKSPSSASSSGQQQQQPQDPGASPSKRSVSFANGNKVEEGVAAVPTVSTLELEELRSIADSRARDIEELRHDRVSLKMDIDALKAKLVELPDDIVAESIPFRLLQSHVQTMTGEYDTKSKELALAQKESDNLRENQETFRQLIFREAEEQVDEVQKRLIAKEMDLTRIRSQREDARAEATELRAREAEKVKNLDQLRTLAQSRLDRIAAYASEVRRLKMLIAAHEGDGASVDLLAGAEEVDIVKDLQGRLKTAEDLLLALRDQVRSYASNRGTFDSQTIAKSETDARLELAACRDRLARLEDLLGPDGNVELRDLAARLEERDQKLKVLEAQLKASDHATNMLYGEIDQLSTAWSTLDEQNNLKVFNLLSLEEKVQRLNTDKAKADNRYFATMRQKDAIAAENQVLTKLAEKQSRAVEAANDLQHSIGTSLTNAEREISLQQKHVRAHQDSLAAVKRENAELAMRAEQNGKHITELNSLLADRISQAESEMAHRKRSEEQAARIERELRAVTKSSHAGSASSSGGGGGGHNGSSSESSEVRELKKYNEDLSKMLKCSTCALRFKGVIINRCGHLFCKECIDARLSNRQRKCPTCGVAFGKDDVSSVYF